MIEWSDIDRAAAAEGQAIKKSFRSKQPRRPQGVNKDDVIKDSRKRDILKELGVINGRAR